MMNEVEAEVQGLPVVERMRAKEGWYETSKWEQAWLGKQVEAELASERRAQGMRWSVTDC
jgi:hypothetical protein